MSEVKRYDLVGDMDGNCNLNEARMELSDDGVYVKHRDYEALQAKCAALAAENAGLKSKGREVLNEACKVYDKFNANVDSDCGDFMDGQTLHEFQFLLDVETKSTDAFLAEVRAQGVEMYADNLDNGADDAERGGFDDAVKFLRSEASGVRLFAAQLRKVGEQK